jgi:cytoskeletal protein CcmA (bactofilin family)
VIIEGKVAKNLYMAGEEVKSRGPVGGDVLAAGRTVEVAGPVDGDVWAAGQRILLNEETKRGVVAFGEELVLALPAKVGTNLIFFGKSILAEGLVKGNLRVFADKVTITGKVDGDVIAQAGEVIVGPRARIGGNLLVKGAKAPQVMPGAQIGGKVEFTKIAPPVKEKPLWEKVWVKVLALVKLLVLALLMAFFAARLLRGGSETMTTRPGLSLGLGLGVTVLAPLVLVILCAIIIGQAATLVLGTFYLSLLALGGLLFKPVAGLVAGNFIFRYLQKEKQTALLWTVLLGSTVIWLVCLVPYLGAVINFLGLLFTVGALTVLLSRNFLTWPWGGGKNEKTVSGTNTSNTTNKEEIDANKLFSILQEERGLVK